MLAFNNDEDIKNIYDKTNFGIESKDRGLTETIALNVPLKMNDQLELDNEVEKLVISTYNLQVTIYKYLHRTTPTCFVNNKFCLM